MVDIITRNLILIFLLLAAFIILFSFLTFIMSIKPGKWPIEFSPESFDLKYENVDPTVHMIEEDKVSLEGLVDRFINYHYRVRGVRLVVDDAEGVASLSNASNGSGIHTQV